MDGYQYTRGLPLKARNTQIAGNLVTIEPNSTVKVCDRYELGWLTDYSAVYVAVSWTNSNIDQKVEIRWYNGTNVHLDTEVVIEQSASRKATGYLEMKGTSLDLYVTNKQDTAQEVRVYLYGVR